MQYFTKDYLEFFKELAGNNHKEWFDQHRKRYESSVREPFKEFVGDLIKEMSRNDSSLQIEPKDAIFRINRDIRFSKDKTPYKLNNSAIISKEGRKNKNYPGIYIEFGPEKLAFYGGIYMPDTKQTQKVRSYFKNHNDELKQLLHHESFKLTFGDLKGDKSKRIPKEFKEAALEQPLLLNKQWYYFTHLTSETIFQNDLLEVILDLERKASPMKDFLIRAIN